MKVNKNKVDNLNCKNEQTNHVNSRKINYLNENLSSSIENISIYQNNKISKLNTRKSIDYKYNNTRKSREKIRKYEDENSNKESHEKGQNDLKNKRRSLAKYRKESSVY